jgi:hypothetical protein
MVLVFHHHPTTPLISSSSIAFTSISWPLVLLSESPCSKVHELPAVVFLPETHTLITYHFYILKSKRNQQETKKK